MADQDDSTQQPDAPKALTFDAEATATLLNLTPKQKLWCLATLRGANKTQAAREAGYGGDSEQLRQVGHRTSHSAPVKRFLELAALEGGGVADGPVDYAELKRIMSKHARGSDKNASINACNALAKIAERENDAEREAALNGDPVQTLIEIAALGPECVVVARGLARANHLLNDFEAAWHVHVVSNPPKAKANGGIYVNAGVPTDSAGRGGET